MTWSSPTRSTGHRSQLNGYPTRRGASHPSSNQHFLKLATDTVFLRSPADADYTVHRMLLGTHTSDNDSNHVQIATVHLPKPQGELDLDKYDDERGEIGTHTATGPRVQITQSIPHAGEVNRARYMPQNPDLIATKAVSGEVLVFDRTKHASVPQEKADCKPDITLRGHSKEG